VLQRLTADRLLETTESKGVTGLQRIEKFRSETTAVIEYYEGKGVLRKVGAAEPDRTVGCLVSIHQCNL